MDIGLHAVPGQLGRKLLLLGLAVALLLSAGCNRPRLPTPVSGDIAFALLDDAQDVFDDAKARGLGDEEAAGCLLRWLLSHPEISEAALSSGSEIVEFGFRDGTPGLFFYGSLWSELAAPSSLVSLGLHQVSADCRKPDGQRAVILDPFPSVFHRSPKDVDTLLKALGYQVTWMKSEGVRLSELEKIHEYGVVFMATHGGVISGQVGLLSGELMTSANWDLYEPLRKAKLIGVSGHSGQFWPWDKRKWWFVTPVFFENSPGRSADSLFYAFACNSLTNDTMWNALQKIGVAAYVGWTTTAYPVLERKVVQRFFQALREGKTVAEADGVDGSGAAEHRGHGDLRLVCPPPPRMFASSPSRLFSIAVNEADDRFLGYFRTAGGQDVEITDIAWDAQRQNLWGISFNHLYRIDPRTAQATPIGSGLGRDQMNALAVDAAGRLFAAGLDGVLVLVSTSTGRASPIGPYGSNYGATGDLVFLADGRLVGTAMSPKDPSDLLVLVNPATGAAARIGPIGYSDVFGLFVTGGALYGVTEGRDLISINTTTGRGTFVRKISFDAWGAQSIPGEGGR